jgi:hypothetical protein
MNLFIPEFTKLLSIQVAKWNWKIMIYRISYRIHAKRIPHESDNHQSHPREIQVLNLDPLDETKSIIGSDPHWASPEKICSDTPTLWQRWRTKTGTDPNKIVKPLSIHPVYNWWINRQGIAVLIDYFHIKSSVRKILSASSDLPLVVAWMQSVESLDPNKWFIAMMTNSSTFRY